MRWLAATVLLLSSFSSAGFAQQRPGTGMLLDDASYESVPLVAPLFRGAQKALPEAVSLKQYAPTPGDQGVTGTCVGWATAYAARSIVEAISNGWTDRERITEAAFSPSYIYNQLKHSSGHDPSCTRGTHIPYALELMKERGSAPIADFPFECERPVTMEDHEVAEPNRILEYSRLFDQKSLEKTLPVKRSLADGKPVVIGMLVPTSFLNAYRKELWTPSESDDPVTPYDGHALTVVGYDDHKFGGAFEVMNSWGTRWGTGGFAWIRYSDFSDYVKYGFDVYAEQQLPPEMANLEGRIELRLLDGTPMPVTRVGEQYRAEGVFQSGTRFEAFASNSRPAYVYAIASDLSGSVSQLVPVSEDVSPFLAYSNSEVALAGDYYFYLDERAGLDYLTVLYSLEPIELEPFKSALRMAGGAYVTRLREALGEMTADSSHVVYTHQDAAFEGRVAQNEVVALTIEIEHAASSATDLDPPIITLLSPSAADPGSIILVESVRDSLQIGGSVIDQSGVAYLLADETPIDVGPGGRFELNYPFSREGIAVELVAADSAGNRTIRRFQFGAVPDDDEPPQVTIESPTVVKGRLRGIGVRQRPAVRRVTGTVSDASGVKGIYIDGIAAEVQENRFFAEIPMAAGDEVLTVRAIDQLGNEQTDEYQILAEGTATDSLRASALLAVAPKEYVTVRVFYGTDRARSDNNTPSKIYTGDRGELAFGAADVSIPAGHSIGELESPVWWRFQFREDPAKHVVLLEAHEMARATALKDMRETINASSSRSAFVFVHGYNTTFEDAARRTAQLAHDLSFDGAPIFYSWPSDGRLVRYTADEADVDWTVANLDDFLTAVAKETGAEHVHLIAHSMGNRAVSDALVRMAMRGEQHLFDEVLLTAPDIDAEVFVRDIAPVIPVTANRVTLYASSKDRALEASKRVHGYPRAGDSGDGLVVTPDIDTVDASEIDTDLLGHAYFAETEPILLDIHSIVRAGLAPTERKLIPRLKDVLTYWLLEVTE